MPEEEKDKEQINPSEAEGEAQAEGEPKEEHKRRIKPVIEELTEAGDPIKSETPIEAKSETETPEKPAYEKVSSESHSAEATRDFQESKSDIKLFVIVAIVTAVVVAALAGGIYVYITGTRNLSQATPSAEPTLSPVVFPEATPTSSPSAALKLSDYKVQILNGSGKIGEANKAKGLLQKAGFKVTDTGNASNFNFTDSVIQTKESVPSDVLDKAKSAISETYSVKVGDNLDSDSVFDIVITVGSK